MLLLRKRVKFSSKTRKVIIIFAVLDPQWLKQQHFPLIRLDAEYFHYFIFFKLQTTNKMIDVIDAI